ncbi:uncharacterized protein BKA55DRAFT_589651 [Fusarium redolens]|uniref:RRM domain-containing protein n=1 Tax=Fusarium redolens TaxID=48865 RepID=A0A9P9R5G1_FUSRE|nr:uncharacterized protein BKA55DRAFT_589651 [Fusarium redolens]KAH7267202.1 hypothetical protein BKA55DRAFT_589651 [Fusarium redolens]
MIVDGSVTTNNQLTDISSKAGTPHLEAESQDACRNADKDLGLHCTVNHPGGGELARSRLVSLNVSRRSLNAETICASANAHLFILLGIENTSASCRFFQPMPAEATVQADVGPGDETGIYYITICNLPFATSWQELKDWTRTACVVDHIEVFQGSTSGWVRVRGRENFERAWGLLNGGVFKGRSIIASDRNRNHSIKIKELAAPPQAVLSQTPQYQHTPPSPYVLPTPVAMSPQYSATPGQYYITSYPPGNSSRFANQSFSNPSYAQQPPVTVSTNTPATYAAASPGSYYTYNDTSTRFLPLKPSTFSYSPQYQHEGSQLALPYRGISEHPGYYPNCSFSSGEPSYRSEYVVPETRKLCVSPFPQQAQADEVKSWVQRKVDQDKIESIEIPKNNDSNYLRGYVFVVFENVSAANIAVEQFNKARFQGRRMIARPTREDAEVEEPTEPSVSHESSTWADSERSETSVPTTPSRRRDDGRRRNEKPQRSKNKGTSSTGSDKKKTTEKKSSSSRKTSGSQVDKKLSSKKASTEKKINVKDGKPVIADGTSHHHDKH